MLCNYLWGLFLQAQFTNTLVHRRQKMDRGTLCSAFHLFSTEDEKIFSFSVALCHYNLEHLLPGDVRWLIVPGIASQRDKVSCRAIAGELWHKKTARSAY